jgi:hypothetical protein
MSCVLLSVFWIVFFTKWLFRLIPLVDLDRTFSGMSLDMLYSSPHSRRDSLLVFCYSY